MRREDVPLRFACDEDPDTMERRDGARHCARCDHAVHDLSAMTEREARAFLADKPAQRRCISYLYDEDGQLVFAQPPPPAPLYKKLSIAALLAAPLLLAACDDAPHTAQPTAQAPLIIQDGLPVTLAPGAAQRPHAPPSPEEQELAQWRAKLAAQQADRDARREAARQELIDAQQAREDALIQLRHKLEDEDYERTWGPKSMPKKRQSFAIGFEG